MLGFDAKIARSVWTVMAMLALAFILFKLRGVIFMLLLSLFFAYMMVPLIDIAERITPPRWPRKWIVVVIYLTTLALIGAGFSEIGARVADEAKGLAEQMPKLQAKATEYLSGPVPEQMGPWQQRLQIFIREQLAASEERLLPFARVVGQRALSTVGSVLSFLVVPVFAFFFLLQGRQLVDLLVNGLPPQERIFTRGVLDEIDDCLGGYIRALLVLAFVTFVFYLVLLSILGVPYALLLALFGGLLDFLPVIGPLIAVIAMGTVAAFTIQKQTIWLVIFFFLYRMIQDYVIQPRIYARGLKLHPLLILIGAFAGEHLGGIPGMLLSIPVMAVVKVLLGRVFP